MNALEIAKDPPLFGNLRIRQRNFAAWERWKGNVGQTIGCIMSGFWRVLQALFVELLPLNALSDRAVYLTRAAADRTNVSQAKPVFNIPYAAMKKIYIICTQVDCEGYPIYGVEPYTGE